MSQQDKQGDDQFAKVKPGDMGIIGNPVEHSMSPRMQGPALRYWWTQLGRAADTAPRYHKFLVPIDQLERSLSLVRERHLLGVNVTVPFKRAVCSHLNEIDEFANNVQSVNTVKVIDGKLVGYNTDAYGFEKSLEEFGFEPRQKSVLVLGLGGTGVVLIHRLLELGIKSLFVWNRSSQRSLSVPQTKIQPVRVETEHLKEVVPEVDLVVNATSVGLKEGDPSPIPKPRFQSRQFVYDVVYHRETEFLKLAKQSGAKTSNGLGMLLHQGAKSFEIWTGATAPIELMRKELKTV